MARNIGAWSHSGNKIQPIIVRVRRKLVMFTTDSYNDTGHGRLYRDTAKFKIRILFEWDGVYDGVYDPTHLRAAVMT